jgi:hypothetical protein
MTDAAPRIPELCYEQKYQAGYRALFDVEPDHELLREIRTSRSDLRPLRSSLDADCRVFWPSRTAMRTTRRASPRQGLSLDARCASLPRAAIQQYEGLKHTSDEHDARWLAHLLRLDILPEGYIYPRQARGVRPLMCRRMQLVQCRSRQLLAAGHANAVHAQHRALDASR